MSPVSFRPAVRESSRLLLGLAGPSGGGKSFSALALARGLAGDQPFAALDTEAGRLLHYADRFQPWHHGELVAPFRPENYGDAFLAAEKAGYPVILVDSASHEYSGVGGLIDWHDEILDRRAGNDVGKRERMSGMCWAEPKIAHAKFVNQLLQVRAHVLLCFRAREAVEFAKENGKTVIRPTQARDAFDGWLIETEHKRMPLAFELNASFLLLPDHPGIPRPIKLPDPLRPLIPLDQPLSVETGRQLAAWAQGESDKKPGRGKRPSGSEDLAAEAKAIADQIVALIDPAKRESTFSAIAGNRHLHADDIGKHIAWLNAQLERARKAAAERGDQDLDV